MSHYIRMTKQRFTGGNAWEAERIPRPNEGAAPSEPIKRKEKKPMTTKRVRILRGAASERWSVEPGQCLDLGEDVVDQLIRSGSARLARPDEALSFATAYDPQ